MVLLSHRTRRDALTFAFVSGAITGAIPAVLLRIAWRSRGLSGLLSLTGSDPARFVTKLASVAPEIRFYLTPATPGGDFFGVLIFVAILAALLHGTLEILRWRPGHASLPGYLLLVTPVLAFLAIHAASDFPIGPPTVGHFGYRYLAVITPCLYAILAVALSRLPAVTSCLVCAALVAPNLWWRITSIPEMSTAVVHLHGVSYFAYGQKVYETLHRDLDASIEHVTRIPDPERRDAALRGVAS